MMLIVTPFSQAPPKGLSFIADINGLVEKVSQLVSPVPRLQVIQCPDAYVVGGCPMPAAQLQLEMHQSVEYQLLYLGQVRDSNR